MKTASSCALAVTFVALAVRCAMAEDDGIPYAPIHPTTWRGLSGAFVLNNGDAEVVIAPSAGRVASLAPAKEESLLRFDPEASGDFANFGGDWLWPVAQNRWPDLNEAHPGEDWPPPAVLEKSAWQATAWLSSDGSRHCLMQCTYGAPLNVAVSRRLNLPVHGTALTIDQRVERRDASDIPVLLWNISQVLAPDRCFFPSDAAVRALKFAEPAGRLSACSNAWVFNARNGTEHKLGSPSERAWIAAQRGDLALVERVMNEPRPEPFPDGGSRVEVYSNTGLGYCEIETLSPEVNLKKGERLQNRLVLEIVRLGTNDACTTASVIASRAQPREP